MKKEYNKEYDKALRMGFNVVALALIILGILQAFAPYMGGPDPHEPEIRQVMKRVTPVHAADVPALLHDKDGKPVMLVLYASWCGPCMVELPRIINAMREGELNKVKPVFLSLDYNVHSLAAYLVHHDYDKLFTMNLYVGDSTGLERPIRSAGSGFEGHIPYIGFFNAKGKMAKEFFGMTANDELLAAVNKLSLRN